MPEGCVNTNGADGVGTKVIIMDAAGMHFDSPRDLLAMGAMDITRYGGLPLVFSNVLDTSTLGEVGSGTFEAAQNLMLGLRHICLAEGYVLFTGETAELPSCVSSENADATLKYNWAGFVVGVYHPDKMIMGETLRPGQVVIALRDDFRSNGFSSVRKALAKEYGPSWYLNHKALSDIRDAATPSVLYDRMLNKAHGWFNPPLFKPKFKMHLIVHLSGGAFKEKLAKDVLQPLGLAADLTDLFTPPPIMEKCAVWRGMTHEERYRSWNGGQGALVVVDPQDVDPFITFANSRGIEAKAAGEIVGGGKDYNVAIMSRFEKGEMVYF
ncbi:MAG: AIR synthase-related protein [Patescibacteria group bacterium]|nr:AIR synthase-related protein [Patescibacteria group bacterium]